ncbi:uncharacterized protein CC84DRAFT_1164207 [Paraphaeosphaeria sporulosa]|uniref:Uncharacterized protein n=1 Tax=Paraphaeosphaeria sporulosa TaxID=1460663 RepID=A0A177CGC1_9PLEO|nr:uncharacterized protein CC84DRAFT_1164207 [Paraphaeosphaeria sporulosa]OAG05747.1 hypothetical protein CC84DRAFT_1164207 [Paraphaeosphaeria sporulosa]
MAQQMWRSTTRRTQLVSSRLATPAALRPRTNGELRWIAEENNKLIILQSRGASTRVRCKRCFAWVPSHQCSHEVLSFVIIGLMQHGSARRTR